MSFAAQDEAMARNYASHYSSQEMIHLYPVEFVVRAFLGTYPRHRLDRSDLVGKRCLDLGCGDGRNIPLLHRLGMEVHGLEIAEDIIASTERRLAYHGVKATLTVGFNAAIPYPDGFFDVLLACHSCYYVEDGTTFESNLAEMRRVLPKHGLLVASLPMSGSHILASAVPLGDGHFRVTSDRYGLRNGIVLRSFEDEGEVTNALSPYFSDLQIGFTDDEYWGTRQRLWIVCCRAR